MTTTKANRVISYFFIYDFYHAKGSTDDVDLFPESIIYFYPQKNELKTQKLLECGEIIGLIQCLKYDLFSSVPKEFNFKKSLVVCEYYGRHAVFLVLPKDRFTSDEANIHLKHILDLFNTLYGTFNSIQSICLNVHQIHIYLNNTLTPIVEYVFNENRSIKNLFSTIDYALLKNDNQQCLLNIKHVLTYLNSIYKIQNGFFAYENRILYSTFDNDTTFYLQVILGLEKNLPANEIYIPLKPETKLKNGVSLIRVYIRRALSLQPTLNAVNAKTLHHSNSQTQAEPINIINSIVSNENEISPLKFQSNNTDTPLSVNDTRRYHSLIQEDPAGSSGEATGFDSDQTGDISSPNKTERSSISSFHDKHRIQYPSKRDEFNPIILSKSNNELLSDDQKRIFQYERSLSIKMQNESEKPSKSDQDSSHFNDSIHQIVFVPIGKDDYETDCDEKDIICLPPVSLFSNFHRIRQRTITSYSDMSDNEHNNSNKYSENDYHTKHNDSDHYEDHVKWNIPEKNDEVDREELILYIQRNSHLTFVGLIEKNFLLDEYLQKLWCFLLTEMADMDREIQVIPIAGDINKHNTDVKFHFNENLHLATFDRVMDAKRSYRKIPSVDSACLAFSAQTKLNQHPERRMIGLSRGNNLISINRNIPDRVTYFCRRFQELQ